MKQHTLYLLLSILWLQGCIVPRHISEMSIYETFEQDFSRLQDVDPNRIINGDDSGEPTYTAMLIGNENYNSLFKDSKLRKQVGDLFSDKQVFTRGFIHLNISLVPYNLDQFRLEGFGSYYFIKGDDQSILFRSDIILEQRVYEISSLNEGILPIRFFQIITPIYKTDPDLNAYNDTSMNPLYVEVEIIKLKKNKVYSIDYQANHLVYLCREGDECPENNPNRLPIGFLTFKQLQGNGVAKNHPDPKVNPFNKVIDLRGKSMLRRDFISLFSKPEAQ